MLTDDELIILFASLILEDIDSPDDDDVYELLSLVLPSPTSILRMASLLVIVLG